MEASSSIARWASVVTAKPSSNPQKLLASSASILDPEALHYASERLARFGDRFRAVAANFKEIQTVLAELGEAEVQGVLADLGVSSLQFDAPERGFSFRWDAPLDMRMNPASGEETAAELL